MLDWEEENSIHVSAQRKGVRQVVLATHCRP